VPGVPTIVPFDPSSHDRSAFDSGEPALDAWLRERAGQAQRKDTARTYVASDGGDVVGYYSLCAFALEPASAPAPIAQGRLPVPAVLLARLAVDVRWQGRGVGSALLLDALVVSAQVADVVGAHVMAVHALHDRAARFYVRHGFTPFDADPLTLYLPMKDIRRSLQEAMVLS
jgi:predicted N-acetyltransferase YhbS